MKDSTRVLDILLSLTGLILLSPVFGLIALWIKLDSCGPIIYRQKRVGRFSEDFLLLKFRTMHTDADRKGLLTVGKKDNRVTRAGHFLRTYKIDELPQLINVLKGEMSIVGPRPEVHRYVALYNKEQRKVLSVKPGITDHASLRFRNENELLATAEHPEHYYINEIMPLKIELNQDYIDNKSAALYCKVIIKTLHSVLKPGA